MFAVAAVVRNLVSKYWALPFGMKYSVTITAGSSRQAIRKPC
jgi:hypothetical protein